MKEYKTNLMNITWNFRKILLMIVLMAFDLIMSYTIADSRVLPLWLNSTGVLMAACVGGPGYGIILAAVETVINMMIGSTVIGLVQGIAVFAIAAAFGTYVRLGFFGNLKGVALGVLIISFINTCIRMPEYFALFGSFSSHNVLGTELIMALTDLHLPLPFVSTLSFFIIDIIDKTVILGCIYALLKHQTHLVAKFFDTEDPLPQCVIVKNTSEEEFLTEKEQLEERAQRKLEQKKAETEAAAEKAAKKEGE